jgi:hypothetical protein
MTVLFPKIKDVLKGTHSDDIDVIRSNTTAALKAIPQNQLQNRFEGWTRHWHRCIVTVVVFSNEVFSTFTVISLQTLLSDQLYSVFIKILEKQ